MSPEASQPILAKKTKAAVYHALRERREEFGKSVGYKKAAQAEVLSSSLLKFLEPKTPTEPTPAKAPASNPQPTSKPKTVTINISSGKVSSTPERPIKRISKIRLPSELTKNTVKVGEDASSSGPKTRSNSKAKSGKESGNGTLGV